MFLDVALVPLVVFWAIGHEEYLLSAVFGVLFSGLTDPGRSYGYRASRIAIFGLIGAAVTALWFGISGSAWGWLTLAAFAVTLLAGLAAALGAHRFVCRLAAEHLVHHHRGRVRFPSQRPHHQLYLGSGARLGRGSALWIAVTFIAWLIRGRQDQPEPVAELPGDTTVRKLTGQMIMFAVIRAVVIGGTVALAFGLNLSHGIWLPIAAIIAMKPSLEQSTIVGAQRLIGALIDAVAAALVLLIPASEHGLRLFAISSGLEVVALIVLMHGAAIRFWNYALYCAAIAAGVLIFEDLPQPSDYAAEGYRILWTLCGVGIGVLVMFLAGLLARRTAMAPPRPAAQPA